QKIVIIFIAFVFIIGMAIMGLTEIFTSKPNVLGVIDGVKITYEDFQAEYQKGIENHRQQNQDAEINTDVLRQISDQTWQRLTQRIVLGKQIKKLGVKITDDDILKEMQDNPPQELFQNPSLQTNGRFDRKKYLTALKQNAEFFNAIDSYMRESLPFKRLMEKVKTKANINLDSLKIEHLKENDEMYGKLIMFNYNKLPKPNVTETEIKAYYEKTKESDKEINKGKSSSMKFIIFDVKPSDKDYEIVKTDIDDIYNSIMKGEDFGQLAKDLSEDPGSAAQFGSLGSFGKGQMVPEFEQMAFSLEPGQVSKPFKTTYGWHIMRVEGKSTDEKGQPQVQASHILKKVSASLETKDALEEKAEKSARLIKKKGIEKAAKELKLDPVDSEEIYTDTEYIPGLGKHDNLLVFVKKKGVGAVSKVEKDRRGNYLVAQVTKKTKDPYVPFEKAQMRIKFELEKQKRVEQMKSTTQDYVKKYKPEELLKIAEKDTLLKTINLQNFKKDTYVPEVGKVPEINTAALKLDSGQSSGLVETKEGQFIIVCDNRNKVDINAFVKDKDAQKKLRERMEEQAWNRWYDATMKKAKIIDNRQEFNLY
ncbi:MAG: peptidylprolyl isomerase, partial [Candidatus Cloacimonetes bacterium]|nr:peptidylprolyl isomerase [Candidatus Cloacimonadota bacterium]